MQNWYKLFLGIMFFFLLDFTRRNLSSTVSRPHALAMSYQLLISDDYYHPKFHFCEPQGGPVKQPESLGSILFGDRIFNSPYNVSPFTFGLRRFEMFIHLLDQNAAEKW